MALLCLFIAFQSVFADWTAPQKSDDLIYDGTDKLLVSPGVPASSNQKFFYRNPWTGKWDRDIPTGHYPGRYSVTWIMIDGNMTEPDESKAGTNISDIYIKEKVQPEAREGLVYDGSSQFLIKTEYELARFQNGDKSEDRFYFRKNNQENWDVTIPSEVQPGIYSIQYILWNSSEIPAKSLEGFTISQIEIRAKESDAPKVTPKYPDPSRPQMVYYPYTSGNRPSPVTPGNHSGNNPDNSSAPTFHPIGDGLAIFDDNKYLPATGFPTRINKPLSIQPETVRYDDLSMRIQIPTINVDVELTGVPEIGNTWAVEWLNDRAGMLSGSAMPGEGYTMVAAHNHLNTQEIGPFGFLFDLSNNDRIFVNMPDGSLKIYSVYANELLEPNDFSQMAAISENEDGSLILVTCENELTDGSYQNRRVVFAKLMN